MGARKNKVNIPPEAEDWYEYYPVAEFHEERSKWQKVARSIFNIISILLILYVAGVFDKVKEWYRYLIDYI